MTVSTMTIRYGLGDEISEKLKHDCEKKKEKSPTEFCENLSACQVKSK